MMGHFKIEKYTTSHSNIWNDFVNQNQHTTFLFHRNFMEYHSDRFHDFSFLIFHDDKLVGICPANVLDRAVYSHQGLTYGGLLFSSDWDNSNNEEIFQLVVEFLKDQNIQNFNIKGLPTFYGEASSKISKAFSQNYDGKIYRTDKVLAIDYTVPFTIHKTKLKHYRRNHGKGFIIEETEDFSSFWDEVLVPRLKQKHNVQPVHSLDEITLLKSRFPANIKQFNILLDDEILAGITIFEKGNVVKSQYGATTERGEKERALEYLFLHLIHHYKDVGKQFFSMGTVTDNNELGYNKGLLKQKEELGCKVFLQEFYHLQIA